MKVVTKLFFIFLLALFFCSVSINSSEAEDRWIDGITVNFLTVMDDSYIIETSTIGLNCKMPGRFIIKKATPSSKEMYATALSALLTGKKIGVYMIESCYRDGAVVTVLGIMK